MRSKRVIWSKVWKMGKGAFSYGAENVGYKLKSNHLGLERESKRERGSGEGEGEGRGGEGNRIGERSYI